MLSTQAKNKIVKGVVEDGVYSSKLKVKFLKIKSQYDEIRQQLYDETCEVERAICDKKEEQMNSRAFKALDENVQWDIEDHYSKVIREVVFEVRVEAGYMPYGSDIVEEFWESSSMSCM